MNELENKLFGLVKCRTKELKNETGVSDKDYEKGFLWERSKSNAMLDETNNDYVTVSTQQIYNIVTGGPYRRRI